MIGPSCITSATVDEAYNPAPFDGVHHDDVVTSIVVVATYIYIDASKREREDDATSESEKREKWPVGRTGCPENGSQLSANHPTCKMNA